MHCNHVQILRAAVLFLPHQNPYWHLHVRVMATKSWNCLILFQIKGHINVSSPPPLQTNQVSTKKQSGINQKIYRHTIKIAALDFTKKLGRSSQNMGRSSHNIIYMYDQTPPSLRWSHIIFIQHAQWATSGCNRSQLTAPHRSQLTAPC